LGIVSVALGCADLTVYRRCINPGTVVNDEIFFAAIFVIISSKKINKMKEM
jgi:hypothetical protein